MSNLSGLCDGKCFKCVADCDFYVHFTFSALVAAGSLPEDWGRNESLPALLVLRLTVNTISGTLPASYLGMRAFKSLLWLVLAGNQLSGTIPEPQPGCSLCMPKVSAAQLYCPSTLPWRGTNPVALDRRSRVPSTASVALP